MRVLKKLTIRNFKSIQNQTLDLGLMNVFIGGNGSGKSNLIQTFKLLREVVTGNLATYSRQRGADALLHYGRKQSPIMEFELTFSEGDLANGYNLVLFPTDEGALAPGPETAFFQDRGKYPSTPYKRPISHAGQEAGITTSDEKIAPHVFRDLVSYQIYHFHDTSEASGVRLECQVADNRVFRPDGSNLAAFLYMLQQVHPDHFRMIQDVVQGIAPFFAGFDLQPSRLNPDRIRLEWKEVGSDAYFNASSLSDGTLRFICLATLLLQPEIRQIILLDEPELGLHPAAITLLGELLTSAATRTQILLATQSVTLVNQFEPDQVWTVDRIGGQSTFRRLATTDLSAWLKKYGSYEGYGLGDLWEKNVLGARP